MRLVTRIPGYGPGSSPIPTERQAVMATKKRTHHIFHAILTVLTGGLWGIVWIVQVLRHNNV